MLPNDDIDIEVATGISQRVARNYAVSVGRLIVGYGVAAAVFILLSRHLSPSDYALYAGFAIAAPVLYQLVAQPMMLVLVRSQTPLSLRVIESAFSGILIVLSFIAVVALLASFALRWDAVLAGAAGMYLIALSFCFPAYTALSRNLRTGIVALIDLADRTTFQAVTAAAVMGGVTIQPALSLALFATGTAAVVAHQVAWPWRPRLRSPRLAMPFFGDALFPLISILALFLGEALLVPIVAIFADANEAGLLGWAWSVAAMPLGFVGAAMQTLFPAVARMAEGGLADAVVRSSRLLTSGTAGLCAALAGGIAMGLPLLVPVHWSQALPALYLLLAALVLYASTGVIGLLWNARVSLREYAAWYVSALLCSFLLSIPLSMAFGAAGAASAFVAGRLILSWLLLRGARRRFGLKLGPEAAGIVVAFTAAAACGAYSGHAVGPGLLGALVGSATAAVLCTALCIVATHGRILGDAQDAYRMLRSGTTR